MIRRRKTKNPIKNKVSNGAGDKQETLPITAYCTCKNGEPYIRMALESVGFCAQRIFVDDSSTDRSVEIAKELGWEIWHYTGRNSMSERRNFAINFQGNKDHTPEWIRNKEMMKKHPEVKYDWILQIDHDEVFGKNAQREINYFFNDESSRKLNVGAFVLVNVVEKDGEIIEYLDIDFSRKKDIKGARYMAESVHDLFSKKYGLEKKKFEMPGTKSVLSDVPLERLFRKGHVYWMQDAQNDIICDRETAFMSEVKVIHYGYGDPGRQQEKQWERMPALEEQLASRPDNYHSRVYLINALSVLRCSTPYMFERLGAQVTIAIDVFLGHKKYFRDRDSCLMMHRIFQHYFHACGGMNNYPPFIILLESKRPNSKKRVMDYIDFSPDMHLWRYISRLGIGEHLNIGTYALNFIHAAQKHKNMPVNMELKSKGKELQVAVEVYEVYVELLEKVQAHPGTAEQKLGIKEKIQAELKRWEFIIGKYQKEENVRG